jgi:phosphoribosylanthranilate isomerase
MFVKICGITTPVDAELAIAAGADALGFNFWPGSRRYLQPTTAVDWIRELPDTVIRVAVVVNPTESDAKSLAAIDEIDLLQLHGAESCEFCRVLKQAGVSFWKAIPMIGPDVALANFHTKRLLLDAVTRSSFGGTGGSFPWDWARRLVATNPTQEFILAGGLTPENVAEAITRTRPFGVDVATGVEGYSGRKDIYRVRDFIAAARSV